MLPINKAAQALGLTEPQTRMIVKHWYLAGFLTENYLLTVGKDLQLPEEIVHTIIELVKSCTNENLFDEEKFVQAFYPHNEKYSVLALAFFQYFQQNHFTKGDKIAVNYAQDSDYTTKHPAEIIELARLFTLLDPIEINTPVDVTFLIGARTRTMASYLEQYTMHKQKHGNSVPYVFLSSRLLDDYDISPEVHISESAGFANYRHYLEEAWMRRYNEFLAAHFPQSALISQATEGLAFFAIYATTDLEQPEEAQKNKTAVFIYTATPNADEFYRQAIQESIRNQHLPVANGRIGLSLIQPYVQRYIHQVGLYAEKENISVTVCGYGGNGNQSPKILVQALAMLINACYEKAAAQITASTQFECVPAGMLQNTARPKLSSSDIAYYFTSLREPKLILSTSPEEIYFLNLGSMVTPNFLLALRAFQIKLGTTPAVLQATLQQLFPFIERFKKGYIHPTTFIRNMIDTLKQKTNVELSPQEFKEAWNQMNPHFDTFIERLNELKAFKENHPTIMYVFLSATNLIDLGHWIEEFQVNNQIHRLNSNALSLLNAVDEIPLFTTCHYGCSKAELLEKVVQSIPSPRSPSPRESHAFIPSPAKKLANLFFVQADDNKINPVTDAAYAEEQSAIMHILDRYQISPIPQSDFMRLISPPQPAYGRLLPQGEK